MENIFDVNNIIDTRGVYPEASGSTTGERASALTPYTAGGYKAIPEIGMNTLTGGGRATAGFGNPQGTTNPDGAGGVGDGNGGGSGGGVLGKPLVWWGVLVVLLVGLMFVAQRFGSEGEDFKSVKLSLYNIVVISLAAMIGFGFFKMLFGRFKVVGLSDYVLAV